MPASSSFDADCMAGEVVQYHQLQVQGLWHASACGCQGARDIVHPGSSTWLHRPKPFSLAPSGVGI